MKNNLIDLLSYLYTTRRQNRFVTASVPSLCHWSRWHWTLESHWDSCRSL